MGRQQAETAKKTAYAALAPVLRGVLWPGSAERLPPRGLLKPRDAKAGPARKSLILDTPMPPGAETDLRDSISRALIAWQRANKGARPHTVTIPAVGIVQLVEGRTGALGGSVAIVTGAAGAIGMGVCETLLSQGCCVALSDIDEKRLDQLSRALRKRYAGMVHAVAADITDAASVRKAFEQVVCVWGGVDIVVANAGIAHVAPLARLDTETFRRLERVNVEGTLHTLSEAARLFERQGCGGDIVLISTKNVFAPGAGFGAYSATKAAAHQLARIASLEMAPMGVRVNMVAPDAVFSHGAVKSGLWATVGPGRMKARGLDEKGLEEYYRGRNLLKARVEARHVGNAVLFFVSRQTPTTGATIPVDGGLPDATPR